jgi:hypothetical protein
MRAFYKCEFEVEEGGANLLGADVTEMVAKLIETLPATRKRAIASSFAHESDAARRATALDIARSLDYLGITRDTPALPFPYRPLTGQPAEPVHVERDQ